MKRGRVRRVRLPELLADDVGQAGGQHLGDDVGVGAQRAIDGIDRGREQHAERRRLPGARPHLVAHDARWRRVLDVDPLFDRAVAGQRPDVAGGEVDEFVHVEVTGEHEHPVAGIAEAIAPHALDTVEVERRELLGRRQDRRSAARRCSGCRAACRRRPCRVGGRVVDDWAVAPLHLAERNRIETRLRHVEVHELEQHFEVGGGGSARRNRRRTA